MATNWDFINIKFQIFYIIFLFYLQVLTNKYILISISGSSKMLILYVIFVLFSGLDNKVYYYFYFRKFCNIDDIKFQNECVYSRANSLLVIAVPAGGGVL